MIRFLLFTLFLSGAANAATTYYYPHNGVNYSNPVDACEVKAAEVYPGYSFLLNEEASYFQETPYAAYFCKPYRYGDPSSGTANFVFSRYGDSCEGAVNPDTGACETAQNCASFKPLSSTFNLANGCYQGCRYENLGAVRDFDNLLSQTHYEYLSTGEVCTDLDQALTGQLYTEVNNDGLDCRIRDDYEICIDANDSCKIINGKKTCFDNDKKAENFYCGTYNSEVVCFPKNEKTNCGSVYGDRVCINSDGQPIDKTKADHPDNGGNGDGDNTNDILDQQDVDNNTATAQEVKRVVIEALTKQQAEKQAENDNPTSSVTGIECNKEIQCTGDVVQCVIARYEKQQACLMAFGSSQQSEIQSLINNNPNMKPLGTFDSDTTIIDLEGIVTDEGRFTEDQTCPDPLGFEVLGKVFSISFDPMCDLAGYIRYFILFATWFSIAVMFAKSM